MLPSPMIFLVMLLSFVVTIAAFVFIVRRVAPRYRLLAYGVGAVISCIWLGVPKGVIATLIAIAFTSGYVSTRLDARRIGKRVATELEVPPNLFFSALEQVLPFYLMVLAQLEREGGGVRHATRILLPQFLQGLDALELRFGRQPMIEQAREQVNLYQSSSLSDA